MAPRAFGGLEDAAGRPTEPTLAGRLGSLGYDTAGFVANLDYCGRETGLARGFAHYEDYPLSRVGGLYPLHRPRPQARQVLHRHGGGQLRGRRWGGVGPWSRSRESMPSVPRTSIGHFWTGSPGSATRPALLCLPELQRRPHALRGPRTIRSRASGSGPRPGTTACVSSVEHARQDEAVPVRDIQMANDIYDDSIAYLDRRLGALLDELGRRGVLDDTVVIVTSDHGEHLGDHLLVLPRMQPVPATRRSPAGDRGPEARARGPVVDEPVSLRDLPATVLDLLGLERGDPFPGRSLARFWDQRDGEPAASSRYSWRRKSPSCSRTRGANRPRRGR